MTVSLQKGPFVDRGRHVHREDDVKTRGEDSPLQGQEGGLEQILLYTPRGEHYSLFTLQF